MAGVIFLEKLGLLQHFIPELIDGIGCEQGGIHAFDVFEHNLRTLQAAADKNFPSHLRLAALFHDVAKPATRRTGGKNKKYTFFGHEVVGARMTAKILERLKFPRETIESVVNLVRWHMFFSDPDEITLAAVRRTMTFSTYASATELVPDDPKNNRSASANTKPWLMRHCETRFR
jgi:putative nucleotidyltransferase with HDIG domain